jgi:DNA polymerase-3 subunit beta
VLEVADLLPAVRAAAIVTSEQSKGVDLTWTSDTLVISGRSSEYGESTVKCPVVVAGETSSTKLDPRYLADFLRTIPADEEPNVDVYAADPTSRVLLRCGPYTGVIMPLAQEG